MPDKRYGLAIFLAASLAIQQSSAIESPTQTKDSISDTLGTVFFIYDGKACDCILAQNAMMHQEIDSALHLPRFRSHWLLRKLEYNQAKAEAERLLNLCKNPLMPVTGVLTRTNLLIFEASGYLNGILLARTLDLLTPDCRKEAP